MCVNVCVYLPVIFFAFIFLILRLKLYLFSCFLKPLIDVGEACKELEGKEGEGEVMSERLHPLPATVSARERHNVSYEGSPPFYFFLCHFFLFSPATSLMSFVTGAANAVAF